MTGVVVSGAGGGGEVTGGTVVTVVVVLVVVSAVVEVVDDVPSDTIRGGASSEILWDNETAHPWQRERSLELQQSPG